MASNSGFSARTWFAVSLGALGLTSMSARAAEQITFVSQGGAYQKAQTIAILDPAAKKLGITINQDSIPDAWPVIKSQVASGKPIWDVVDVPTGDFSTPLQLLAQRIAFDDPVTGLRRELVSRRDGW